MSYKTTRLLTLRQIIGSQGSRDPAETKPIIPVSRATWWRGVATGRFPPPVEGLGGHTRYWREADITKLLRSDGGAKS